MEIHAFSSGGGGPLLLHEKFVVNDPAGAATNASCTSTPLPHKQRQAAHQSARKRRAPYRLERNACKQTVGKVVECDVDSTRTKRLKRTHQPTSSTAVDICFSPVKQPSLLSPKQHWSTPTLVRKPHSSPSRSACSSNGSPSPSPVRTKPAALSAFPTSEEPWCLTPPNSPRAVREPLKTPCAPLRPRPRRFSLSNGIFRCDVVEVTAAIADGEDVNSTLTYYDPQRNGGGGRVQSLPLLLAAVYSDATVLAALLRNGAVVNSVNSKGQSALHLLCIEAVKLQAPLVLPKEKKNKRITPAPQENTSWKKLGDFFDQLVPDDDDVPIPSSQDDSGSESSNNNNCAWLDDTAVEIISPLVFTPPRNAGPDPPFVRKSVVESRCGCTGTTAASSGLALRREDDENVLAKAATLVEFGIDTKKRDLKGRIATDYLKNSRPLNSSSSILINQLRSLIIVKKS